MERKFITHSQLGINYEDSLSGDLAEIFLHTEYEWLSNAHVMYWSDTGEVWATEIYPKLLSNTLEPHDIEDVAAYLPRMLHMLVSIDISEPEYQHLKKLEGKIL